MFDLPVKSAKERKEATRFRKHLLDLGFAMAQYSVYVQYLPLASRLSVLVKSIKSELPRGGDVRILNVADNQWAKTVRFSNQTETVTEESPPQLTIF